MPKMRLDPGQIEVIDDDMAEIFRQKTPAERLAIVHGMWRSARQMILAILRSEHPDWTEQEILKETARRLSHGAV